MASSVCLLLQFLHQLTARAVIRDYENGTLSIGQAEHEVWVCVCGCWCGWVGGCGFVWVLVCV